MRLLCFFMVLTFVVLKAYGETVTIESSPAARQPQVAIGGDGHIHLTFGADRTIFYACSTDGGATYRTPTVVGALRSLALGMRRGPRIAVSGGTLAISAIGTDSADSSDGNVYSWRSKDHGATWEGPVRINDPSGSAREGLHGFAAGPDQDFYCTWLDLRHHGTQIFGSRATNGCATWSKNVLIYQSPDGTVCECCHPSVALDANGQIYVMWRNLLAGNRDMFLTSSRDHGETFAPAVKLGAGTWPLKACPMDGGALIVSPTGKVAAIWRRDRDIFLTDEASLTERRLGNGMQPWLAAGPHRLYAVWLTNPTGKLFFAESPEFTPIKLDDEARFPTIAACPNGNGPVAVAWESSKKDHVQIKIATFRAE